MGDKTVDTNRIQQRNTQSARRQPDRPGGMPGRAGRKPLWLTLGATAMLTVASIVWWIRPDSKSSAVVDCAKLATHTEQTHCLDPYFQIASRSGTTRAALHTLTELVRVGTLDDCHLLAHDFGHVGFEIQGSLTTAMRTGDASCLNGYYHGVVEAALHHAASEGKFDIANMCGDLRGDDLAYDACDHGLGHGLMHVTGDVMQSRQDCASLPGNYDRHRCVDGVLMENSMRYLDLDDAHYRISAPRACAGLSLSAAELDSCDAEIGEIAMFHYKHDLNAAFEICREIGNSSDDAACERGAREELATSQRARPPG